MKRLIKISRNAFILVLLIILTFYIYLLNAWKIDFTEEEIKSYISEVKYAEQLPDLFYDLYNLNTNNSLEYQTFEYLFNTVFYIGNNQPVSVLLARKRYIPKMKKRLFPKILKIELSLATKIDSEISPKEQFNFMLNEIDFVNGQIGVKSAAKYYFNKDLKELNKIEIATLIVMIENPSLYNPIRRPDRVKNKVELLLNKYNNCLE